MIQEDIFHIFEDFLGEIRAHIADVVDNSHFVSKCLVGLEQLRHYFKQKNSVFLVNLKVIKDEVRRGSQG